MAESTHNAHDLVWRDLNSLGWMLRGARQKEAEDAVKKTASSNR